MTTVYIRIESKKIVQEKEKTEKARPKTTGLS